MEVPLRPFLLLAVVTSVTALSCLPCDRSQCPPPPTCKADVITDVCGCCDACAKVEGETCGGPWNVAGRCSSGLVCAKDPKDFNAEGVCIVEGKCVANSHWSDCASACPQECGEPLVLCRAMCRPGCECDEGFILSENYGCVPKDQCGIKQCPPGSHWDTCGSACPPKCGEEGPKACIMMCVPSCVCDDRSHVWNNDLCIPRDACPVQSSEYNGRRYELGESWGVREEAGKNCLCDGRGERCLFVDCSAGSEQYLTEDGIWDCRILPTRCPPGVQVANCFADPCQVTKCPAYPGATCRSNYCGGCNAVFFNANDKEVNCNDPYCPSREPYMSGVFCGRGPNRQDCPRSHFCNVHPTDLWAVCCPKEGYGECPSGYFMPKVLRGFGQSLCYRFVRRPASYGQAEASCRADGGRLVIIHDLITEIRIAFLTILRIRANTWIGLSDRGRDGRFVWSDNVRYDKRGYSHWRLHTLNTRTADCVYMSRRDLYRWRLARCSVKLPFICEYDPFNM